MFRQLLRGSRGRRLTLAGALVLAAAVGVLWDLRRATPVVSATGAGDSTEAPEEPELSSVAHPRAAPAPTRSAVPPVPPPIPSASEEDLLSQLARLNATDKPGALALALSMDDAYPASGANAEARRAMIITLLVDLGRMDEARQRVSRYIEAYPDSPYLPLVEGKTGIHPRPSGPRR